MPGEHPSELRLELYLSGELTGADRSELEAHSSGCPSCGAELLALRAVGERYASSAAALGLRERLATLRAAPARRWRAWAMVAAPLALAATLAVIVLRPNPEWTAKGAGAFSAIVHSPGGVVRVGDAVKLEWRGTSAAYLAAIGVAPDGTREVLYPSGASAAREGPGVARLGDDVVLEQHGVYRFSLLVSDQPFPIAGLEMSTPPGARIEHREIRVEPAER